QAALLRSNLVLKVVAQHPEIRDLAGVKEHEPNLSGWLSESLKIDYPNDAEILRIRMTGNDPEELRKIVNAAVDSYLKEVVQHEKDVRNAARDTLEKSWNRKKADLARELDSLFALEKVEHVNTSKAVEVQKRVALDSLEDAMAKRNRILAELED